MRQVKHFLYLLIFPVLYSVCWLRFKLQNLSFRKEGFKKNRFLLVLVLLVILGICFYLFLVARPFGHRLDIVPLSEETKIGEDFRNHAAEALKFFSLGNEE